jgi:hypothetical protein
MANDLKKVIFADILSRNLEVMERTQNTWLKSFNLRHHWLP